MLLNTILSPDEAKQARAAVGLSQSKVAEATGISRTTLALFEVNKYLLDDAALRTLKQFYEARGHAFSNSPTVEQPMAAAERMKAPPRESGLRLVDGFVLPAGMPDEDVESILAEIQAHDAEMAHLFEDRPGVHWWTEQPNTEGLNKLLALSARNYVLTRRLQGHELLNNAVRSEDTPPEAITNGMLFNAIVAD